MVVCLYGNINQDIIFVLERFPEFHEKVNTRFYHIGQGGSAANTSWWLSRLGVPVRMMGSVGRDAIGDEAVRELTSAGVDTSMITRTCKRTGIATIFSCGQDKRMVKVRGANEDIAFQEGAISGASHIHLSSLDISLASKVLRYANDAGITTSWDPSESLEGGLLSLVDFLFINENDYDRMKNVVDANPPKNLVVTLNGGGCVINDDTRVPPTGIDALETTGAGDAFDAGFIYGIENGLELGDCGRWAVACAYANTRAVGARDGFISREELSGRVAEWP